MSFARLTLVRPVTITPAMLTGTNVPETDHPEWLVGSTYALGARVMVVAEHAVYESLQAANTGRSPAASPEWWIRVSPTNRWKAFDRANSSRTEQALSLYYELTTGQVINSVGLLAMRSVTTARVRMTDPTFGVVYDRTIDNISSIAESTWHDWLFGVRIERSSVALTDLPSYPNATVRVDLTGLVDMAIGVMLLGQQIVIGHSISHGAAVGITDYSRKEADEYGEYNLVRRSFARRASFPVNVMNVEVDGLIDLFAEIRAEPCLWVGGVYDSLTVYGFYKEFEIVIGNPVMSECLLEIEGMT
jgi:hypothetical protein